MVQRRFEGSSDYGKGVRKQAYLSAFLLCLIGAKSLPKDTEALNLEAGHVEIQDRLQKAIFTGSVRAKQGDMSITANAANVSYSGKVLSSGERLGLKRVVDNGNVTIKRPYETATGNWAIYNLSNRTIIDRMAERLAARPDILAVRRETVEHPFGSIKQWMNQDAFLTRGLEKVRAEFSLTAFAYNLRRAITIIGVQGMIRAAQA